MNSRVDDFTDSEVRAVIGHIIGAAFVLFIMLEIKWFYLAVKGV